MLCCFPWTQKVAAPSRVAPRGSSGCEAQKPFPGAVHRRTSVGAVYLLALAPLPASHAAEVTP